MSTNPYVTTPRVTQGSQSNGNFISTRHGRSLSKGCFIGDYDWYDSPDCSTKTKVVKSSGFATPLFILLEKC